MTRAPASLALLLLSAQPGHATPPPIMAPGAAAPATPAAPPDATPTCGIRGYPVPVGTAVMEATFRQANRPFIGFNQSPVPIVRANILSPPCQGSLVLQPKPLGFRYTPRPGYVGADFWVIEGCTARGQCVMQAFAVHIGR